MRGVMLLIDIVIVSLFLFILLFYIIPVHQEINPLVNYVIEQDRVTVALEKGEMVYCKGERITPYLTPACGGGNP